MDNRIGQPDLFLAAQEPDAWESARSRKATSAPVKLADEHVASWTDLTSAGIVCAEGSCALASASGGDPVPALPASDEPFGGVLKLLGFFIIGSLVIVLLGKLWVGVTTLNSLYVYGVSVTLVTAAVFVVALRRYRDPFHEAAANSAGTVCRTPLVTILVAVKDEEDVIAQCIDSLVAQDYTNKEIIVVNDASSDGTKAILRRYAGHPEVHVLHLRKNVGKKRALAKGVLRARGELFAFTDSDSVAEPEAIGKVVDAMEHDPLIGAISGHCRALNGDLNLLTKIQDSWYEGQFSIRKAFESSFGAVTCVSGPLAVFRREAIFNFIPAWEHDTFLGQEFRFATDRTLTGFVLGSRHVGKRLKEAHQDSPFVRRVDYPLRDWKVVYCKSAKVLTNVPQTFPSFIKQQIRWKKSFIRSLFFTGTFYWRRPLVPAAAFYAHALFVVVGPFIVLRHVVLLPLSGNLISGIAYLAGIAYIGLLFGFAFRLEDPTSNRWMYRPLMSLMSTLVLSWLLFYSALTIRKMSWARG